MNHSADISITHNGFTQVLTNFLVTTEQAENITDELKLVILRAKGIGTDLKSFKLSDWKIEIKMKGKIGLQ